MIKRIETASGVFIALSQEQLDAFLAGYTLAIRDYGIYKNGEQRIGCLEKPVREAISEMTKLVKQP